MAEDVVVQFGAKIDELEHGVMRAKETIESVQEGAAQLYEGFERVAEIIGVVFSVEAFKEFINSMGELGEKTERTMAILGMSSRQVGEMGFVAKMTGSSEDSLALAMERLAFGLQRAQSGSGPVAKALEAMGLQAKDLIGLKFDEILGKVADKFKGWEDGPNKAAIAMALFGRAGAQAIPILDKGSEGIKELGLMADQTGSVLSEQMTKALVDMQHQSITTGAALQGLKNTVGSALAPAMTDLMRRVQEAAQSMNYLITSGNLWDAALEELKFEVLLFTGALVKFGTVAKDVFTLNWGAIKSDWAAGTAELERVTEEHFRKLGIMMLNGKMQMQAALSASSGEGEKTPAPAMPFENKGATNAAVEQIKAQIDAATAAFDLEKDRLGSMVKMHEITHTQETQALLRALAVRVSAEETAQNEIKALYPKGSIEYEKAQNELTKIENKFTLERQKINEKEMEENVKDWQTAISDISSAWNSQLRGLLDGTETWASAMKKIVADLVIKIIEEFEKAAETKIALGLGGVALGGGGIGGALFSGLGKLAGFQVGTNYVPQTGAYVLHEGEAVIPAEQNTGGGSGATNINISIQALDGASVQRIAPQLAKQIAQAMNLNPTLRPAY